MGKTMDSHAVISALPLAEPDRSDFIETANLVFERVIDRIEPENRQLTRSLWDPARYVDHHLCRRTCCQSRGIMPFPSSKSRRRQCLVQHGDIEPQTALYSNRLQPL